VNSPRQTPPGKRDLRDKQNKSNYDRGVMVKRKSGKPEPHLSSCMTSLNGWLHSAADTLISARHSSLAPSPDQEALEENKVFP
jgi:hypothetical protein